MILCSCEDCNEWYSHFRLYSVSQVKNTNESFDGWYQTDFFNDDFALLALFIYSADGYENCKSKTMIHSIVNDSTIIYCNSSLVVGNDTLTPKTNLNYLFELIEKKGHNIYRYDNSRYSFPKFDKSTNTFTLILKLNDNKVFTDSCVVRFD